MANLNTNQKNPSDTDIDIMELLTPVWRGKWVVAIACVIAGVVGVAYSLSLPNEYRSEVLLAPAEEANGGGLSALAGQFGGLASLAGCESIHLGVSAFDANKSKKSATRQKKNKHAMCTHQVHRTEG